MNRWVMIYRFAWGLLVALFAIGLICVFVPRFHSLQELQRRRKALQEENRETEARIMDLQTKQERFLTDPAFVEHTARRIGMVKSGEAVFKLTNGHSRTTRNTVY